MTSVATGQGPPRKSGLGVVMGGHVALEAGSGGA